MAESSYGWMIITVATSQNLEKTTLVTIVAKDLGNGVRDKSLACTVAATLARQFMASFRSRQKL
jgi:hypothetical protein